MPNQQELTERINGSQIPHLARGILYQVLQKSKEFGLHARMADDTVLHTQWLHDYMHLRQRELEPELAALATDIAEFCYETAFETGDLAPNGIVELAGAILRAKPMPVDRFEDSGMQPQSWY
jgi:hypothetical protein